MKRLIILFFCSLMLAQVSAQTPRKRSTNSRQRTTTVTRKKTTVNKKTQLSNERAATQKARKRSQQEAEKLNRTIKANLDSVLILDNQIGRQQLSIDSLQKEVTKLNAEIDTMQSQLTRLQKELTEKKAKYAKAVVYLRKHKSVQEKLMFIFSADNLAQIIRRMRYVQEYSTYQKAQGQQIKEKQQEVKTKQNELLAAKARQEANLNSMRQKQQTLVGIKSNCQTKINFLNKNLATVQKQIKDYQKKEAELNAQIEKLIQQEIEEAKRRAEAERKRKEEEEEAKRKAEEQRKANERRLAAAKAEREKALAAQKKAQSAEEKRLAKKAVEKANSNVAAAEKTNKAEMEKIEKWKSSSDADRKLSSNFASNKGNLPMPITGSYSIVGHYGTYTVSGLKNVKLDNKGIDIRGQQGAQARAVFNGEVSSVFQYGPSYIVMVRHGSYISVYSGLSSVSVQKGAKVNTRTPLGTVGKDSSGNIVLHFQLRKESSRLNPEQWVR